MENTLVLLQHGKAKNAAGEQEKERAQEISQLFHVAGRWVHFTGGEKFKHCSRQRPWEFQLLWSTRNRHCIRPKDIFRSKINICPGHFGFWIANFHMLPKNSKSIQTIAKLTSFDFSTWLAQHNSWAFPTACCAFFRFFKHMIFSKMKQEIVALLLCVFFFFGYMHLIICNFATLPVTLWLLIACIWWVRVCFWFGFGFVILLLIRAKGKRMQIDGNRLLLLGRQGQCHAVKFVLCFIYFRYIFEI